MFQWWKDYRSQRELRKADKQREKELNGARRAVYSLMKEPAFKVEPTYPIMSAQEPHWSKQYTTKTWLFDELTINRVRLIGADLITVHRRNRQIASWADQKFQHDGIGVHDFICHNDFPSIMVEYRSLTQFDE